MKLDLAYFRMTIAAVVLMIMGTGGVLLRNAQLDGFVAGYFAMCFAISATVALIFRSNRIVRSVSLWTAFSATILMLATLSTKLIN